MWFGLIGPLTIKHSGQAVSVPSARLRVLLAALLAHPRSVRSQDELTELVWDGRPPAMALVTLRSYIARLRSSLGPDAGSRVVTRSPGYLVEVKDHELDIVEFGDLCRAAAATMRSGAWQQSVVILDRALELWRGTPLVDVPCQLLQQAEVPRLEELRLQALEDRMAAHLHLGRSTEVIADLLALANANPLREQLQGLLMLAFYRCGRQADALQAYRQTRVHLASELGIEPSYHLQILHQQMLSHDARLEKVLPPARPLLEPLI